MREEPEVESAAGAPAWMVTFADLMSLLLTFFVLLLSFSSMEIDKFNTMAGSIRSAFGMRSPFDLAAHPEGKEMKPAKMFGEHKRSRSAELNERKESLIVQLREVLEQHASQGEAQVRVTSRGVVLQVDGDILFSPGQVELDPRAADLLETLVTIASTTTAQIEVEGHTDDQPTRGGRFASNWELSAARAGSAVRFLAERGVPAGRLRAVGYGATRPVAANETVEGRARNRRVEFLFLTAESYEEPATDPGDPSHSAEGFAR